MEKSAGARRHATSVRSPFDSRKSQNVELSRFVRIALLFRVNPINPEYEGEINSRSLPMIPFVKSLKLIHRPDRRRVASRRRAEAPKRIDVKQFSKKVEDVVVPLPNEVFGALNKLGGVNWKEYVRNEQGKQFHRASANCAAFGNSDCRWLHRGAGGRRSDGERHWAARPEPGEGDWRGQFDHAARQGHHRSGRQAQMGQRAAGIGSHAEQRRSRR